MTPTGREPSVEEKFEHKRRAWSRRPAILQTTHRILRKPCEPNAVIKNDTEYIPIFCKSGSYRTLTTEQWALWQGGQKR